MQRLNRFRFTCSVKFLTTPKAHKFLSACRFCDSNVDPAHPGTLLLLTTDHTKKDKISSKNWLANKLRAHWSKNEDEIAPILSRIVNSFTEFAAPSK